MCIIFPFGCEHLPRGVNRYSGRLVFTSVSKVCLLLCLCVLINVKTFAVEAQTADKLTYKVSFDPAKALAKVAIGLADNQGLKAVTFNLAGRRVQNVKAAKVSVSVENNKMVWQPALNQSSQLTYEVSIPELRKNGHYSAYVAPDWLIMRAEDLVPPFRARFKKGYKASATLNFDLPAGWSSVNTGYLRKESNLFVLPKADQVPSPKGWVIAGKNLNTRHDSLGNTAISVSGPNGHETQATQMLVFIGLMWPQLDKLVKTLPEKLLIVVADDPMWRGGLSATNGLFVHTERPLISENGTSTLLHELIHVLTGIRGDSNADWIAEGLAEYYSVDLIYRAGGYSKQRYNAIFDNLLQWGSEVKCLNVPSSSGAVTARAVVLFSQLDREIQKLSDNKYRLDHIVQDNFDNKKISLSQLKQQFLNLVGSPSKVLEQPELCEHREDKG